MKIPSLHGSRLTLRPFFADDVSPLHGIYQMEDVLKFFPGPINPPLESVERFVSRQDTHWQAYGFGNWVYMRMILLAILVVSIWNSSGRSGV